MHIEEYTMIRIMLFISLLFCFASPPAIAKVNIVTTIPDFGSIAREIGGELVSVKALVRPTQDPHYLDAKPSFIVDLNRADLVLLAGLELEAGWLPPLLSGARNPKVQRGGTGYLDCATLIIPKDVQTADRSKGDIHPGGNPHYWYDPRNGVPLAKGIAARLIALDDIHSASYQKGLQDFLGRLEGKLKQWGNQLAAFKGTRVVVYHQSWVYFLDFAGLVEVGTLEPKPGIPPSPDHVAALIGQVKDSGVKFVLQESFYPTQLSQLFAKKSGAALKVLPTMVGAGGTRDYLHLIDTLVNALTSQF